MATSDPATAADAPDATLTNPPAATHPAAARPTRDRLLRWGRLVTSAPALGVGLLGAYGVLLLTHMSIPQPVDHSHYMDAAYGFPTTPSNPINTHQYLRIGLTAPTALVMKFFGYSEVSNHLFPVVAAMLLVASTYTIGYLLFGRIVGTISAVLLACTGIVLVAGTELLPDLPATALFTAAVALTLAVRRGHRFVGTPVRRRIALVLIGVLLGWSYLVREFIVFVWPLVPILLWRRVGRFEWLWGAVPPLVAGLGEMALNARMYGDPLARLHASSGLGDLPSRPDVAETFHDKPLLVYLGRLPEQLANAPEGPFLLALLAATVVGGLVARRRIGVFLLWVALLWVPLTLLGGVLNPHAPKLRLQLLRYWYPLFPAIVIGGVAATWLALRWWAGRLDRGSERGRTLIPGVGVGLLALAMLGVAALGRPGMPGWEHNPRLQTAGSGALTELRSWLGRHREAHVVWADRKLFRILPIYFRSPTGRRVWRGQLRGLVAPTGPAPGEFVVVYSVGSNACPKCGDEAQIALGRDVVVPGTWTPVMTSGDGLLRVWQVGAAK